MRNARCLAAAIALAGCTEYDLTVFEGVEVFTQNPPDAVDILLVIDNSCSMEPYQQKLGANFDEFLTWFIEADVDYQIGVITTDMETSSQSGRLLGRITSDTENASARFDDLVNVGIEGSAFETGLWAAQAALSEPLVNGANDGFLREDASLSLIFVSDEEDASPAPVNDYINEFFELKGARSRNVFNASALTVMDKTQCSAQQAAQSTYGTRYVDVATQTGGLVGDLCADNFDTIVNDLSLNASRLRSTFYLSDSPRMDTLQVGLDDEIIPCDAGVWIYDVVPHEVTGDDRPAIIFQPGNVPAPNTRITVRYDYGSGAPGAFCEASSAPE